MKGPPGSKIKKRSGIRNFCLGVVLNFWHYHKVVSSDQLYRFEPLGAVLLILLCAISAVADDFQGATHVMPFDEDTIAYSKTPDTSIVARLQARLDKAERKLTFQDDHGYLRALLKELGISPASQMLVGSKTSFQRERISPATPRALYFNDEVYVGYIPGAPLMEIAVADPKLGGVFYTIDQKKSDKPRFVRMDQCLECHASAKTMGVPGHLVRSFDTDESGVVDLASGVSLVNHRTPLSDRWGGWYVTGEAGKQIHRGNLFGTAEREKKAKDPEYRNNITNLNGLVDLSRYPSAGSDVVALMVLEHQTHMHNFITRLNYAATMALKQYGHINYLKSAIDAFMRYLLFTEETSLTGTIEGTSDFAAWFIDQGPKDKHGRSLREFDLRTRLFKYPCSYLIYSDAFDALPGPLKDRIYGRLVQILTGKDSSGDFDKLSPESRSAILQILAETKPDFRAFNKASLN